VLQATSGGSGRTNKWLGIIIRASFPPHTPSINLGNLLACCHCVRHCQQQLIFVDEVNLLGENRHSVKVKAEALFNAAKAYGLEVNMEKKKNR
jgi:hypothetical protein